MKLNYKQTFLVGMGFFTVSIVWAIYNIAVPTYLDKYLLPGWLVGAIMAIDNLFAVIFQPIFGSLSDKTRTVYGRRMPFLLIGIPLSAIGFFIVPFVSSHLAALMVTVIFLNFSMSIYRSPAVALMPDLTPPPLRSKANGIINLMGGIGTAIALLLGGLLFRMKEFYPFAAGTVILIVTILVMYNFIKEPGVSLKESEEVPEEEVRSAEPEPGHKLSLLFMLLAIFFWFVGYNAIETFFSIYGKNVLGVDKSISSYLLLTVSVLFLVTAVPAGILASKIGRKKTIMAGLCMLIFSFVCLIFLRSGVLMYVILGVAGISWALININSYPMVVEMASSRKIGKFTGYYYFFSMAASIITPILYGFIKDFAGDGFLFIYATIASVIALFFMMLVKHGEAPRESVTGFEALEHVDQ